MEGCEAKPDIFISYTHTDATWVRMLASRIESETVDGTPTGRLLRVFFAEWDITAGQNIVNRINEGLEQARFVALVMSPQICAAERRSGWQGSFGDSVPSSSGPLI